MNKTLILRAATAADELHCQDGELLNANYMFAGPDTPDPPVDPDNPSTPAPVPSLSVWSLLPMPEGARFLSAHGLTDGNTNLIVQLKDGSLRFVTPSGTGNKITDLTLNPKKIVAVGEWLVILAPDSLLYSRWTGDTYEWFGKAPSFPVVSFVAAARALPPYSYTDNEKPRISITATIGSDTESDVLNWLAGRSENCSQTTRNEIVGAVKAKLKEFMSAVKTAGLHMSPIRMSTAMKLTDGSLWQTSEPQMVVPPVGGALSLAIVSAACEQGAAYLTLELSRLPFSVECTTGQLSYPWTKQIEGIEPLYGREVNDFNPEVVTRPVWLNSETRGFNIGTVEVKDEDYGPLPNMGCRMDQPMATNIFSIGGRLLTIGEPEESVNEVATSRVGFPFAGTCRSRIAGGRIMHLTNSLRSHSGNEVGDSPLYAFCSDGIRALTPAGSGGFRDVQLISRHVAFEGSFAPMPESTAFITSAGVMRVEGTKVSLLDGGVLPEIDEQSRLLYLYEEEALVVYRSGVTKGSIYGRQSGKWRECNVEITDHHYGWPAAWVMTPDGIGKGRIAEGENSKLRTKAANETIPIKTRTLKLGDPFAIKKLEEVEALWADGSQLPLKVYGAMRLDKWYFLGLATRGRMIMRGSGWRFFRIETFATTNENSYCLPQIFIKFAK